MSFDQSTNWHDPIAPGQELGKAERQLDAAISNITGGGVNSSGLNVIYISTSDGAVANSAAEGSVLGADGVGSTNLPAGFFAEGVALRVTARGYYSSAAGTATLRMRIKLGSTIVITTGDFIPPTATERYWEISAVLVCRTAGVTGTVMPSAHMSYNTGAGAGMINTAASTIDTTAAQEFDITADWDAADASNSVTCTHLVLEKMQVGNASLSPDDITVEFLDATSIAVRNAEEHIISVELSLPGGQLAAPVTVDWTSTNVVMPTSGTVTFPAGSANGAIQPITLLLDYTAGNPQVTLSNASSNATLGSATVHTATIRYLHRFAFNEASGSALNTTYGNGGFSAVVGRGVHASNGWVADPDDSNISHHVNIFLAFASVTVTRMRMHYNRTNGQNVGPSFTGASYYGGGWAWVAGGTASPYQNVIQTNSNAVVTPPDLTTLQSAEGSYTITGFSLRAISGYADPGPPSPTGEARIAWFEVEGDGLNPFA